MAQPRFLPDPEQAVIDKLTPAVGVTVSTREPAPRPARYLRVFRIDAATNRVPVHETITLTVEAWHKSLESAALALAQTARQELSRWGWEKAQTLTNGGRTARIVSATPASGPINLPSTDGWARYTFNVVLVTTTTI